MNTMKLIVCAAAVLGSTMAFGQAATSDPTALAKARVAQLTTELGLTQEQAAKVQDVLVAVETEAAPERAKCAELQASIDSKMKASYVNLKGVLTPEQMAKLRSMPVGCDAHAGCSHDAKATAGCAKDGGKAACCAGKAGATGAAAPAKANEPMKTTIN
ncbi:MAG: hypothetical protein IPG74_05995 [Flavobacteriales bacterium]|nr:hypothetical protein [Flavobacteriales bacterium]MBK7555545.1 hypothetical protein [Flavobacteriales bacterium]